MTGYYARRPGGTGVKSRPPGPNGNGQGPASEAQRKLLEGLLETRKAPEALHNAINEALRNGLPFPAASAYITALLSMERIPRDGEAEEEGYYEHRGDDGYMTVYRVHRAKRGHLYALERNDEGQFKVLAKGMIHKLNANELVPEVEAVRRGYTRS